MTDTIEEIRARHEDTSGGWMHGYCDIQDGEQAHADRATLLPLAERCAAAEADLAKLQEPDGVLINMMRGTLPKVPASSLHKLYTEDELIDAAKAVFRERAAQLLKDTP